MATEAQLRKLCEEVRELSLGTSGEIERLDGPPSPLRFLRDFVLPNKPCIIANAIDHWPALTAWTNAYLVRLLRDQIVSVHLTPDGRADSPVNLRRASSVFGCSVVPAVSQIKKEMLLWIVETDAISDHAENNAIYCANGNGVIYASKALNDVDVRYLADDHVTKKAVNLVKNQNNTANVRDVQAFSNIREQGKSRDHIGDSGNKNTEQSEELCPTSSDHSDDDRNQDNEFWFATAHVERLPFPKALELILEARSSNMIAYAQEQNGSFLSEYNILIDDADVHIPWATEALGCMPEAVNFWIGTEKSVTSFHKDHYENLYAVVCGEKHFTLLPPTDVHRLYVREYPSAHYTMHGDIFVLEQDKNTTSVPWVSVDPYPPPEEMSTAQSQFPEYFYGAKPFVCTVRAGELLYLPSMWFHHVRQSPDSEGRTIAVNFWYDMQFDIKYAYYNFVESLMRKS